MTRRPSLLVVLAVLLGGRRTSHDVAPRPRRGPTHRRTAARPVTWRRVRAGRGPRTPVRRADPQHAGLGSGVVFDARGNVVTNAHVVGGATSFRVTLATGDTPATLGGSSRRATSRS